MVTFRQMEQRHVSSEVTLMKWNPTMDLLAMATTTGEILLHRLSWQKVWSIPPFSVNDRTVLVSGLAWRPDGRILAYSYENGKVTLCDVENAETVHVLDAQHNVTYLSWIQCTDCPTTKRDKVYKDRSEKYLPRYYASNKAYASKQTEEIADDFKKMKGQKELNMLVIGTESGLVHLHAFGMFPVGYVDVKLNKSEAVKLLSVNLSADFKVLSVVVEEKTAAGEYCYHYRSFYMSLLDRWMEEVKVMSLKYGQIASLLAHLSSTLRAISEAWEDILMEVDTKLHTYAAHKQDEDSSISDDFLELLMFGNPSDSLERFLMHDLTESGLKKFGHSIEMSYSNIQKLVLKRLQNVASSLYYHLNEFRGMAQWKGRFDELGLDEEAINAAVLMTGSFLLKATEIQQVIDTSMKNFKAFFRWLYAVILRLSEEPVPVEVSKLSEQDLNFVAEFLKDNFVTKFDAAGRKTTVKLERVAQYLKNEDLAYPANTAGNPWMQFLDAHPEIYDTRMIFRPYPEKSLVSMFNDLRVSVESATRGTWEVMHKTVAPRIAHLMRRHGAQSVPKVSSMGSKDTNHSYTLVTEQCPPCNSFYLLRENSKGEAITLEWVEITFRYRETPDTPNKNYQVLDVKFYNQQTISVLLMEDEEETEDSKNCPVLFQLPLQHLLPHMRPLDPGTAPLEQAVHPAEAVRASQFMEPLNSKRMEGRASQVAVSGTRKVVCVLHASLRTVRLFEMEVDDDEEGMDDSRVADSSIADSSALADESVSMDNSEVAENNVVMEDVEEPVDENGRE